VPSLYHSMHVLGEQPRDIAKNATKQADLLDETRDRGLKTTVDFDDWDVEVYVFGPEVSLRELLAWAEIRETYPEYVP
jgi:hypothetical protein